MKSSKTSRATTGRLVFIGVPYATRFVTDVFAGLGVPRTEAAICADVLVTADRRGIDSHGMNRVKPIYYDRIRAGTQDTSTNFEIVRETITTAVVDGHNGMGHVIGKRAMDMAIRKARKHGIGMVAVRNSTHYGIAGYYALMAIKAGMIGICGTNARPSIAPTFGVENMLGTNALAFGMPTDEPCPFLIDCATSVSQRGKIEMYERMGKDIPAGWVIDRKGRTRTDTSQILKDLVTGAAALTPLGGLGEETAGYKGYGYATAVEIMSAAFQSGSYLKALTGVKDGRSAPIPLGHFFVAIDPGAFLGLRQFRKTAGAIVRQLRASKKAPGKKRIYTAGEKEYLAELKCARIGIPVPPAVQRDMIAMRDELGLKYRFPFEHGKKNC